MNSPLITALSLATAVAALPSTADAWCQMTTTNAANRPGSPCVTTGQPLEWSQRCIAYGLEATGSKDLPTDQVRAILQASFGAWLGVRCDGSALDFDIQLLSEATRCDRAKYNSEGGNVNTIAFVTDWDERMHDPAAYALTTVWHNTRTGEIYDADMEINEMRGTYTVCPDRDGCTDGSIDLQNVITHEAGHFLGMGHSSESVASMFGTSPPGEIGKRILRTDDTNGICSIYPPGSLTGECEFTPRGGLTLTCDPEDGCGCSVPGSGRSGAAGGLVALVAALALVGVRRRR